MQIAFTHIGSTSRQMLVEQLASTDVNHEGALMGAGAGVRRFRERSDSRHDGIHAGYRDPLSAAYVAFLYQTVLVSQSSPLGRVVCPPPREEHGSGSRKGSGRSVDRA